MKSSLRTLPPIILFAALFAAVLTVCETAERYVAFGVTAASEKRLSENPSALKNQGTVYNNGFNSALSFERDKSVYPSITQDFETDAIAVVTGEVLAPIARGARSALFTHRVAARRGCARCIRAPPAWFS
jgi:hypothetical protein